ncbi:MAG: DUF445 domain-containing protein, partial [Candidatus Omnitrophica bacterium]|nr:DUF445 domain-containing protein [Candidatus Omnitrophota bacterium]
MNKSLATNLTAGLVIVAGYVAPAYQQQLQSIGFFALSGALTNWLAVYMLFEKVPLLYGSGVIPSRFEEFKGGIKQLIMDEFFTDENVDKFFQGQQDSAAARINVKPLIEAIDFDKMFDRLIELMMNSTLGNFLSVMKASNAFEPLRPTFKKKMELLLIDTARSPRFLSALEDNMLPSHVSREVLGKIEEIVDQRLDELTPDMVKNIIQRMIRAHLGWLV